MPKLRSTYDRLLIYKTSYDHCVSVKLAYDIPNKKLSTSQVTIVNWFYDNLVVNCKTFCKSGPRSAVVDKKGWCCCHCFGIVFVAARACGHLALPSVLWHCWLGVRKSIRPVKFEWWGVGVVICLQRGAGCLLMVQLMPLPSQKPHHTD